jgi:cytochrome oxidase Cu insertion factor (SCO1/SenC/PrrC family)
MKNIVLFSVLIIFAASANAQTKDSTKLAPFLRYPTLPPIEILLSDSSTTYTKAQIPKNKPVLFMIFSPDCSHCQQETQEMIDHIDELKDVQIVMITLRPLWMMKDFITTYGLEKYPNIVIGQDVNYITPPFFDIHNIPYMAIYNKKGTLVEGIGGTVDMEYVIDRLEGK